ncbi:MAG: DUF424 family protein [Candidatus Bilamarchaeaceae archaeon]
MYLKITEREGQRVVAVCDKELLGKVFEEKGKVLDLQKYAYFYKGDIAGVGEVTEALSDFSSANLVGKKAVGLALVLGLAEKSEVKEIASIPHLQIYKL